MRTTKELRRLIAAVAVSAPLLWMAGPASADLIYDADLDLSGTGLGAVDTLVTVQDNNRPGGGDNGTESGCNTFADPDGAPTCLFGLEGGDNQAINNVILLSDVDGIGSAGELTLVVNVAEPGSADTVVLTHLYFSLYSTSGVVLGSFRYAGGPLTLAGTGTGRAGAAFVLDDAQAAIADALCPDLTQCLAAGGVQFGFDTTRGAHETVFVTAVERGGGGPGGEVPEPGTLALLGLAMMGGLAAQRARRIDRR